MHAPSSRPFILALAVAWTAAIAILPAGGQEKAVIPAAPRLLPERTLGYIRIDNVTDFRAGLAASPTGQMLADPKLKPIASELYVIAGEAFQVIGDQLGLSLDELANIPKGQFSLALIANDIETATPAPTASAPASLKDDSPEAIRKRIEERRAARNSFGGLIVVETGDDDAALQTVLESLQRRMTQDGFVSREETISGTRLTRIIRANNERNSLEHFSRDGVTVIGIGNGVAADALDRWNGNAEGLSLAEATDFAAVMSRCIGAEDELPQITFFVNPYHIVERIIKSSGGPAGLVWPIIESLGLGKIRGIGGSVFQGGETFSDISHMHVLLDPPRDGIFGVVRPALVETNPPDFVPADVTSYLTVGWRVDKTFDGFERIFDTFAGDGNFAMKVVDPFEKATSLDLRESLVNTTKDRGVILSWLQKPVALNSNANLWAVELKDAVQTEQTITKLRETIWKNLEIDTVGTTRIYRGRPRENPRQMPAGFRTPEPCAAIVDGWLVASDSRQLLEHAIRAASGSVPRLSDLSDYDLVASEIGAQMVAEKPFMFTFSRDSEVLRQFYELAKSPQTKERLKANNSENPIVKRIIELMDANELPPFDQFKKFFAPSGGFGYDEATGLHLGRYTLKSEIE